MTDGKTLIDTVDSDTFTSDPGAGIECGKVIAMTDLVKRLRRVSMDLGVPSTTTLDSKVVAQAADRIEALERILGLADDQRREWEHHCKEAEAKLSKAVEAVQFYADPDHWEPPYANPGENPFSVMDDDQGKVARATLAELTGGKDE